MSEDTEFLHKAIEMYRDGEETENSLQLFENLAEKGNIDAQIILGIIYSAREKLDYNIQIGRQPAIYYLTDGYFLGEEEKKVRNFLCGLCSSYYLKNTKDDYNRGIYWLSKAYEHKVKKSVLAWNILSHMGTSETKNILGDISKNGKKHGRFFKQNYELALEFYTESARAGNADAQNNLGDMYYNGYGIAKNYKSAINWYTDSANQGNADAQNSLGYMHEQGKGFQKDLQKAIHYYQQSAGQNNCKAQYNLGRLYFLGEGVSCDNDIAIDYLSKSAKQNNSDAQKMLGNIYLNGNGVNADDVLAYMWLSLAEENGDESVEHTLDRLDASMDSEDTKKALEMAKNINKN